MTSITCRFQSLGGIQLCSDPQTWRFNGRNIAQLFARESDGDIHLSLERGDDGDFESRSRNPDTLELQTALARLTGNKDTIGPVSCIGVLYAGTYRPFPQMLGIMFDRSPAPTEPNARLA